MTDPGSSQRPAPPSSPQGASGGVRRERADDVADPVLAPREIALIDAAITPVARRGRGPAIATVLVVVAFLVGLLRPWDLVVPPPGTGPAVTSAPVVAEASVPVPTSASAPTATVTCAYPLTWRTATIESWTGRQARVWKAAEVKPASGPDDPAIPFEPIVAADITAIGWCAPVQGPDRPPLASSATLYRMDDGVAKPIAYDRLEPPAPDALGELLVPKAQGIGKRPTWPMGRYVIEIRSASGSYVRYLGLELSDHVIRETPSLGTSSAPGASASP